MARFKEDHQLSAITPGRDVKLCTGQAARGQGSIWRKPGRLSAVTSGLVASAGASEGA
jgi:hypothetical protein